MTLCAVPPISAPVLIVVQGGSKRLLSGAREYRYLQTSVAAFPAPDDFAGMMRDAGLRAVRVERLTFGAAHLYVGHAPAS